MFNIKMSVEKSSIINQIKNIAVIIDHIFFPKNHRIVKKTQEILI